MKVGLDISQISFGGGVSVYTENLAKELSNQHTLEMVYFYSSLRNNYQGNLPNVKRFKFPPTLGELFFNQIRLFPIESLIGKVDIFHSSDWVQPPAKAKKVTTYHDLVPILYPQWSHPKIVEVHQRRLKLVEKEIDMVIAVSHSTKQDLLRVSSLSEEKITVVYEGVEDFIKAGNQTEVEAFKQKYQLPDQFVLAMGGIGERKNLDRIKKAVHQFPLIITGENINKLSRQEMPLLYSSAEVLVYTPLYEGFGLPIIEAMACGCPVVTSNISSMPEVAGKAAVLVEPRDVEDISKGLNKALEKREQFSKAGLDRAKEFTWKKTAQQTLEVYQQMFGQS